MTYRKSGWLYTLAWVILAMPAAAQTEDVGAVLTSRGAPGEFVERVSALVEAAGGEGLPTTPLIDKALEGWAKRSRVPPDRVLMVLEQVTVRLREARTVVVDVGLAEAPGTVVAAVAEGMGRGLTREQVGELIRSAPTPAAAATGVTIASALGGQGLDRAAAVKAVMDATADGSDPSAVLELPSVVANLISQGVPMSGVARMVLQGPGLPTPGAAAGMGANVVPPGEGRRPPGRGRRGNG